MAADSNGQADLQTLASLSPSTSASSATLEPYALTEGQKIERYTILERIGAGGMGVVYAAFDAKLDRKVAIKLLHRRSDAQDRLVREARAMAKLNHPNIVTIHDVGSHEGTVYMAMEFAEGRTLRHWVADAERDTAEIVEVFVQAGEGIAAAHAVGLVHRDFKPENVMVSDAGRVKVMDFGLARASTDALPPASDLDAQVTDGSMIGTPAYMAPEQIARAPLNDKTDQFAFCVALYEALYGRRPFVSDLLRHRLDATLEPPPAGSRVPTRLRAVMLRGLAREPADRHPDMRALLEALRAQPRRRHGVLAGFLGGTVLVAGGIAITVGIASERRCEAKGDGFAGTWNDTTRVELDEAFRGTDLAFAEDAAGRVMHRVDAYVAAWGHTRTEVCLAQERWAADEDLPPPARCLERLRGRLEVSLAAWVHSPRAGVIKAPAATANLVEVSRCLDPEYLARLPDEPDDPDAAAVSDRIDRELEEAEIAGDLGRRDEVVPRTEAAHRTAVELGHEPLVVLTQYRLGAALADVERFDDAAEQLEAAYFLAGRIRHDDSAAKAASRLARVKAERGASPEVELWMQNALMMSERGGLEHAWDFTVVLADLAVTYDLVGNIEEGVATWRRCLELERELGNPYVSWATLTSLGEALRRFGSYGEAEATLTEAIALAETTSGPDHVDLSLPLFDRGSVYAQLGRFDDALADFRRAERIAKQATEMERTLVGIMGALGNVQAELGDNEGASEQQLKALVLQTKLSGADHADVATWHMNLGVTLSRLGRYQESHDHYDRAIAIRTKRFGADHPSLVSPLINLAQLYSREGNEPMRLATIERALPIAGALRAGHPLRLGVSATLGEALVDAEAYERAVEVLREALATVEGDTPPSVRAALEHSLALALVGAGGNRVEAEALAMAAAARLEQSGANPQRLEHIRQWLAQH